MSVTTKETTAHGRVVYINEAHRYFTAAARSSASLPVTGFMSLRLSTMHRMT